jgi:hypothetical protein
MPLTDKENALRDLKRGDGLKTVRERYGIKRNTLNASKTSREKIELRNRELVNIRSASRARATPPVDRLVLRRIARQLVRKLDTGLMCEKCDGEDAAPLKPGEFLSLTKAYVTHLDALARSLEVEGTLGDAEAGADELDLDSPETVAA